MIKMNGYQLLPILHEDMTVFIYEVFKHNNLVGYLQGGSGQACKYQSIELYNDLPLYSYNNTYKQGLKNSLQCITDFYSNTYIINNCYVMKNYNSSNSIFYNVFLMNTCIKSQAGFGSLLSIEMFEEVIEIKQKINSDYPETNCMEHNASFNNIKPALELGIKELTYILEKELFSQLIL